MIETYSAAQLIAAFFGLYCIAAGVGLLTQKDFYSKVLGRLRDDETLGFITGFVVFVIGALIVSIHNAWSTPLEIIVSILGWGALIEGLLFLAVRRPFMRAVAAIPFTDTLVKAFAIVAIVLGAALVSFLA